MNHVYILGGLRSYIGVKDGMYRHIPAEKLGAEVLREVVSRFELPTGIRISFPAVSVSASA